MKSRINVKKYRQALFLYHVKEREYRINQMMAECMRQTGIVDEIIIEEFYYACYNMFNYKPDIIVTFLPRDNYGASFLSVVKFLTNAFVISIPTEGVMEFTEESMQVLIGHNAYPNRLVDLYMFWGNGLRENAGKLLLKQNKVLNENQMKVFGYLPYEEKMISIFEDETKLSKRIEESKRKYKRCVMFVTGFQGADCSVEDIRQESIYDVFGEKEREKAKIRIDVDKYYRTKYLEVLENSAKTYDNYLFLLKTHPVELEDIRTGKNSAYSHLEQYQNIIIIKEDRPISLYIKHIDLFIHYGSTAAMEAYIYKIPSIQLLNRHEKACVNNSGTCIVESTMLIDVKDTDKCVKAVGDNIPYTRLAKIEKQLYDYMNYNYEEKYEPSMLFKSILNNLSEPLALSIRDESVIEALKSRESVLLLLSYIKKMFVCMVRLDVEECKKILKWISIAMKRLFDRREFYER